MTDDVTDSNPYEGCTMASTLTEPPMEAAALEIHYREQAKTVYPEWNPGVVEWHRETPRDWFRLPEGWTR